MEVQFGLDCGPGPRESTKKMVVHRGSWQLDLTRQRKSTVIGTPEPRNRELCGGYWVSWPASDPGSKELSYWPHSPPSLWFIFRPPVGWSQSQRAGDSLVWSMHVGLTWPKEGWGGVFRSECRHPTQSSRLGCAGLSVDQRPICGWFVTDLQWEQGLASECKYLTFCS